jgi:ribokinase
LEYTMITVVGSANMDLIARVPHLPAPGETVLGTSLRRAAGGKGANQAVAIARAAGEVVLVCRLGRDAHGAELRESLRRAGVQMNHVTDDPDSPTGTALIAVDEHGENSIVVIPGANARVSPTDVDRANAIIWRSTVLVLQLEIPLATVKHAAQVGRAAGTLTVLNPAPARMLEPPMLQLVDVLVANEHEVGVLSGMGSPVDPASAAHLLLDYGIRSVVVTLGSRGAVIVTQHEETDVPAFPVEVVDSTGAGDAFVGNLARSLHAKQNIVQAARFAAAAAALSVREEGAQPAMPRLEQTERFLTGEVAT